MWIISHIKRHPNRKMERRLIHMIIKAIVTIGKVINEIEKDVFFFKKRLNIPEYESGIRALFGAVGQY